MAWWHCCPVEYAPDVAFNIGVEIGQFLALGIVLIGMGYWRRTETFGRHAFAANAALIVAGLGLVAYQTNGYFQHS